VLVAWLPVNANYKALANLLHCVNTWRFYFNCRRLKRFGMYGLCYSLFVHAVLGFLSESNLLTGLVTAALILLRALGVIPKSCPNWVACLSAWL
jgi:hypothetical protein